MAAPALVMQGPSCGEMGDRSIMALGTVGSPRVSGRDGSK